MSPDAAKELVRIATGAVAIEADLHVPDRAAGLVIFAHGSGSSRFSRRNLAVAGALESGGFGTLLLDLLTPDEESIDERTREYRFNVDLLGQRVVAAIDWMRLRPDLHDLPVALFGASTGAAAALSAAAARPESVQAVISRGGRTDLADKALPNVQAPTLLIVGGRDEPAIDMNRDAIRRMRAAPVKLKIVPGATHVFEGVGTLEEVTRLAIDWCQHHLGGRARAASR